MNNDQLLDRMLAFADSPDCPQDQRQRVINGAWKTWAYNIPPLYTYNQVKKERVLKVKDKPKVYTRKRGTEDSKYWKILQIDIETDLILNIFESCRIAADTLKINYKSINMCANHYKSYKTAGGYKWEYIHQNNLT